MLPRKIYQNLLTVIANLVLFEQILSKFFASKSKCFSKNDAFCLYIFNYACAGRKAYCYRKDLKLWKNCIHQKHV